jgi:monoamine oxidase
VAHTPVLDRGDPPLVSRMGSVRGVRVAVIGAGFAGLAAAVELVTQGHEVTVFEARDRVGGRVWSAELAGAVIERGAEFVLDGYDVMREYVGALDLELAATGMSYYVREPRGGPPVTVAEVAGAAPVIRAAAVATGAESVSVTQLLAALPLSDGVREAVASRTTVSSAWPAEDLSVAALVDSVSGFDSRPTYRVSGGNQRLAEGLAQRLTSAGGRLELSAPVISVATQGTTDEAGVSHPEASSTGAKVAVVVRTEGGEHICDAVVVTVPLTLLAEVEFRPALPDWKVGAMAQSVAGQAAKLHVPLAAGLGVDTSAVLSVRDRYWCWTATDGSGAVAPVVNCFAGSSQALAALDVDSGPSSWIRRLADLRPDLGFDAADALLTTWHDDPWAQMAYTAHAAGRHPDPNALARPVGPLHFAGEHTDVECGGLMEGALRSGRRAAAQVDRYRP